MEKTKHKIITLCGSTRYKDTFLLVARALALEGYIVLTPNVYSKADHLNLSEETINTLVDIQYKKIAIADEVFIINLGGYIGESTKNEIAYAKSLGKNIIYLEEVEY